MPTTLVPISSPPTLVPFCTCGKCCIRPIAGGKEVTRLQYDYAEAASARCMEMHFPNVPLNRRILLLKMFSGKEVSPPWEAVGKSAQPIKWRTFNTELRRRGLEVKTHLAEPVTYGDEEIMTVSALLVTTHQKLMFLINSERKPLISRDANAAIHDLLTVIRNDVLEITSEGTKTYLIFNPETQVFDCWQKGVLDEHFPLALFSKAHRLAYGTSTDVPIFNWRAVFL